MAEPAISFRDVSLTLADGRRILDQITLDVDRNTVVALLGRSGSGKTTLLRTVNGLAAFSSGDVLVEGRSVPSTPPVELRRSIGYVIQESGLFPHMDVARNVALSAELTGKSPSSTAGRVDDLLNLVGLVPGEVRARRPWQLSGGQRQRVGVARALMSDPAILLMDEPFGALDPRTRREIQDMLRALQDKHPRTTLIVTHDLQEALYLAQRIVFLEGGKIVADLSADDVPGSEIPEVRAYVEAASLRSERGRAVPEGRF